MNLRPLALCVVLLAGCRGEEVQASATDAADVADVSHDDVATDVATPDSASPDVVDASDAGTACNPPGNLFSDPGASGFRRDNASLAPIAGPCGGWGYRMYDITKYGSVGRELFKPLPSGTKIVARAWFKASGAGGPPPNLFVTGLHLGDAGEVRTDIVDALGDAGADWTLLEAKGTLATAESSLLVTVASTTADPNEFAFGGISIVIE